MTLSFEGGFRPRKPVSKPTLNETCNRNNDATTKHVPSNGIYPLRLGVFIWPFNPITVKIRRYDAIIPTAIS
jgi:hypothetical protein